MFNHSIRSTITFDGFRTRLRRIAFNYVMLCDGLRCMHFFVIKIIKKWLKVSFRILFMLESPNRYISFSRCKLIYYATGKKWMKVITCINITRIKSLISYRKVNQNIWNYVGKLNNLEWTYWISHVALKSWLSSSIMTLTNRRLLMGSTWNWRGLNLLSTSNKRRLGP